MNIDYNGNSIFYKKYYIYNIILIFKVNFNLRSKNEYYFFFVIFILILMIPYIYYDFETFKPDIKFEYIVSKSIKLQ